MRSQSPGGPAGRDELRCECGSLLARILSGEIELKCRRCKRVVSVCAGTGPEGQKELLCRCLGDGASACRE